MRIQLNGEARELPDGATVAALIQTLGLGERRLAVEHNGRILRRAEFSETVLQADDRLEIVQAIGGG